MGKLLLILIIAMPLFTGCSQTDVLEGNTSVAVSFDTHIGKSSRAVAVSRFKEGDTIGVYMYQSPTSWATDGITGSNRKMENVSLRLDAGVWMYTPTQFWKQDEKYTFFAYAPYKENAVISNGVLSYTVGNDETKQEDLLYSVPSVQTKDRSWDGSATVPDKVQFVFTHALAQVKFSVATEYDYSSLYTIELTDIKLNNVCSTGSLNLISENATIEPWSGQAAPGAITYSPSAITLNHATLQPVTNSVGDVWMLLPQTLPENAEVEFTVHLTKVGTMGTATGGDYTLKAPLTAGTWEHNKVYNYQVTLNMDQILGVRPIMIGEPEIVPWEEEPEQEIYPILAANVPEAEEDSTITEFHVVMSYMIGATPITVISKGSGLPWTISVDGAAQSWLRLADNKEGTGAVGRKIGEGNRIIYAYAISEVDYNGADRNGTITISRAEAKDITIHVTQGDFAYVNGVKWARGNLRENGSGVSQDRPDYGGFYFKTGSLIGVKPIANYVSSAIAFRPDGYSVSPSTWADLPYQAEITAASYNSVAATGDICKYLSDKRLIGASGTVWRLPSYVEGEKLAAMPQLKYGDFVRDTSYPEIVPSGFFIGKNALIATNPVNPPKETVFMPAAGIYWNTGRFGGYNGLSIYCITPNFHMGANGTGSSGWVVEGNGSAEGWGYAVRCVRSN